MIAHRGFSHVAPENTPASFRLALATGVDLVELDIHQTKDGELVVFHDRELDRTTDAVARWKRKHIRVNSKTAAEIQSLDAGAWFAPAFTGTQVPLLSQALDVIQNSAIALIERKSGDPLTLLKLLQDKALLTKVIVQSFDWCFLSQLHQLVPDLALAALGPPSRLSNGKKPRNFFRKLSLRTVLMAQKTGAKIVVWNKKISKRAVRFAHSRSLRVWTYTINDLKVATRLLKQGVDGFIRNNPPLIRKAIAN